MPRTSPCLHCAISRAIVEHFDANPDQLTERGRADPADLIGALMACVGDVVSSMSADSKPGTVIFAVAALQAAINNRAAEPGQRTRH
jgi:hypothetical protein